MFIFWVFINLNVKCSLLNCMNYNFTTSMCNTAYTKCGHRHKSKLLEELFWVFTAVFLCVCWMSWFGIPVCWGTRREQHYSQHCTWVGLAFIPEYNGKLACDSGGLQAVVYTMHVHMSSFQTPHQLFVCSGPTLAWEWDQCTGTSLMCNQLQLV